MLALKEPERITLAEALTILERHLPTEQAKLRVRQAFIQKAFRQEPLFAFSYDEADIDWKAGSVKIPRKRDRFCPTFLRSDFKAYFFEGHIGAISDGATDNSIFEPGAGGPLSLGFRDPLSRASGAGVSLNRLPPQAIIPTAQQRTEVLSLKPSIWGMSIDLKEAGRRVRAWWRGRN